MVEVEWTPSQAVHAHAAIAEQLRVRDNAVTAEALGSLTAAMQQSYAHDPSAWDAVYAEIDLLQDFEDRGL